MTSVENETDLIPDKTIFENMLVSQFVQEMLQHKSNNDEITF